MAPQVGLEPTTLRLTAVRVKTLSAVSSVACRGAHPKSRPQLGYMGYTPELAASLFSILGDGSYSNPHVIQRTASANTGSLRTSFFKSVSPHFGQRSSLHGAVS